MTGGGDDPVGLRRERDALVAAVAARDEALARLTARLLELEAGRSGPAAPVEPAGSAYALERAEQRAELAEEEARRVALELEALRSSRSVRWAASVRAVAGRSRRRR